MTVEVLKEPIQPPAPNNLNWVFRVRLDGGDPVPWTVFEFDLGNWFKEAIGRYPDREGGDRGELEDIRKNWDQLQPRLAREAARQAEMGVKISVMGLALPPLNGRDH